MHSDHRHPVDDHDRVADIAGAALSAYSHGLVDDHELEYLYEKGLLDESDLTEEHRVALALDDDTSEEEEWLPLIEEAKLDAASDLAAQQSANGMFSIAD